MVCVVICDALLSLTFLYVGWAVLFYTGTADARTLLGRLDSKRRDTLLM